MFDLLRRQYKRLYRNGAVSARQDALNCYPAINETLFLSVYYEQLYTNIMDEEKPTVISVT